MQKDLFGKNRYKINLHTHTTRSDGKRPPEEVIARYASAGYDAIALTDHWQFAPNGEANGMTVLSGAEYNILGNNDAGTGIFHILTIGATEEPAVAREMSAQELVDAIHRAGGLAILAHPAWSLDSPEIILPVNGFDATEIYNSISGVHHSRRADSSLIVDLLACRKRYYPLLATDDAHYYDGSDDCVSWVMVEADDASPKSLLDAIRREKFYATQGPEIHLFREDDGFTVRSSPVREIVFFSNAAGAKRVFEGDGLTEAHYIPRREETYVRAQVTDAEGRAAWSNIIPIS